MNRDAFDDSRPTPPAASGAAQGASSWGHTLPEGTRVGEVEIDGLIGEGGFGIVYLATDPSLQRQVAVKEYMPSSLAGRSGRGFEVAVKSERHRETFEAGRKSFVNEARLLARFDHPSLVKVYRFWEANGTAYMMMPFYEGPTLKRALADLAQPPNEATLRSWLDPLLEALDVIHRERCFHRDIAPDNILLTKSGPLLLDFGAARRVIGDLTHALTVVLKPGYAPIEQYGESSKMTQGAWTDLYALACVVYYAITGRAPMTSVERLMDDGLQPLLRIAAGRYSDEFLRAIDAALAVKPNERPQDVEQFRALLDAGRPRTPVRSATSASSLFLPSSAPAPLATKLPRMTLPTAQAPLPVMPRQRERDEPHGSPATVSAARRGGLLALVGLVALAGAGAAGWWVTRDTRDKTVAPAVVVDAPIAAPVFAEPAEPASAAVAEPVLQPETPTSSLSSDLPPEGFADENPAPLPAAAPAPVVQPPAPIVERLPARRVLSPSPGRAALRESGSPAPAPYAEAPAPAVSAARKARCSDILQKASLEALSAEEVSFLRKECK